MGIRLGWLGILGTGVAAVLVLYTSEQLAYGFDQVQRVVGRFSDTRGPLR